MTVATTGGSSTPWGDLGDVGLEDVSPADISMPRIQIAHDKAVFRDGSTNEEMETLDCIVLGLVKQRIKWDTEVDDGDHPQCKSPDAKVGYPQLRLDIPTRKQFPWAASNFSKEDFKPDEDGLIALPCDVCIFKDWGKDSTKPTCAEQFSLAVYYRNGDGQLRPGIISFQRSGAKAARSYAGTFAAARQPMFTVWTQVTLRSESRGKVIYATPTFSKGMASEQDDWSGYADNYRQVREWLHQKPRVQKNDEDDATTKAKPAPASAKAATKLEDDDPWATAAPAATPAAAPASTIANDDLPF